MKHTRFLAGLLSAVLLGTLATSAMAAGWTDSIMGKDLDSLLAKQLNLSGDQSKGSLGAIFGLAKEKLTAADYDKVAAAIPGADNYVAKAKKLGLLDKPIENKDGLSAAFTKLGISKETAAKILPTVNELIGRFGGEQVKTLMAGILG